MANDLEKNALSVVAQANAIMVYDDVTCQKAANVLTDIKAMRGKIAASCDPVIEAAHKAHKAACAQKNDLEKPLIAVEVVVKGRIGTYTEQQAAARRAEEARLAAEAKRKAEEAALAEAAVVEASGDTEAAHQIVAEAIAAPPPVVEIAAVKIEGVSTRKAWTFRITDATKIPREYMLPDEKKIRAVVKALGATASIPGVQAYQETVVASRRSRDEEVPV